MDVKSKVVRTVLGDFQHLVADSDTSDATIITEYFRIERVSVRDRDCMAAANDIVRLWRSALAMELCPDPEDPSQATHGLGS